MISFQRHTFLFPIVLALFLLACEQPTQTHEADEAMLNQEIQSRLTELEPHTAYLHALGLEPQAIHKRFQDILLMTKDIENLKASVNIGNAYTTELCEKQGFNPSSILKLNTQQSLSELAAVLKQNELTILNYILLQKLDGTVPLHSAK